MCFVFFCVCVSLLVPGWNGEHFLLLLTALLFEVLRSDSLMDVRRGREGDCSGYRKSSLKSSPTAPIKISPNSQLRPRLNPHQNLHLLHLSSTYIVQCPPSYFRSCATPVRLAFAALTVCDSSISL